MITFKLTIKDKKLRVLSSKGFSFKFTNMQELIKHPVYDYMTGKDIKECEALLGSVSCDIYTKGIPYTGHIPESLPNMIFDRSQGIVSVMLEDSLGEYPYVLFTLAALESNDCRNDAVFNDLIKKVASQYEQLNNEKPVSSATFTLHKEAAYDSLLSRN